MRERLSRNAALILIVLVQVVCSLFFIADILIGIFGIEREPLSWELRELIEIGAAIGLGLGVVFGAAMLARILRRNRSMEDQLRRASGAFAALLDQRFTEWGLTRSERDVAWFTIKGMTIAEIAKLRETSEGTVKAQSNAIYRKSGVAGRTQLLSLFLEDLLTAPPPQLPAPTPRRAAAGGSRAAK